MWGKSLVSLPSLPRAVRAVRLTSSQYHQRLSVIRLHHRSCAEGYLLALSDEKGRWRGREARTEKEGEEGGIYQCANSGHIGAIVHTSYISCS